MFVRTFSILFISPQAPVEEDFLTLVAQAGDNPAKADMQKFVKEKKVLFDAFKWSTCKYDEIYQCHR